MSNSTEDSSRRGRADRNPPAFARRVYWAVGAAAAVLVVALVFYRAEPRSNGRGLDESLILAARSRDDAEGKAAEAAIREMGSAAAPFLVDMIGSREPAWWRRLCKWTRWTPLRLDPEKYYTRRSRALGGFWALGRAGRAAGPALARLLAEPDSADEVIFALGAIGEVKPLVEALPKSDAIRRSVILEVLGSVQPPSSEVLGIMRDALRSRDAMARLAACDGLKSLGTRAIQALRPDLEEATRDPNEHVRAAARAALASAAKLNPAARGGQSP